MEFSLLRLPYVAFNEVLKSMNVFELVNFSSISPITTQAVKTLSKSYRNKFSMNLGTGPNSGLAIDGWGKQSQFRITTNELNKSITTCQCGCLVREVKAKSPEDVCQKLKELVDHLVNIFNCGIGIIAIDMEMFPDQIKSLIDCIALKTKSVEMVYFQSSKGNHEEIVEYFLGKIQIIDELNILFGPTDTFRVAKLPKLSKSIRIRNGQWITLRRLLEIDCPIIRLENSNLTNGDLNGFIKTWMESKAHLNLKLFGMNQTNQNLDEIVHDVEHVKVDVDVVRNIIVDNNHIAKAKGGIDIRRNDGKIATLYTQNLNGQNVLRIVVV